MTYDKILQLFNLRMISSTFSINKKAQMSLTKAVQK